MAARNTEKSLLDLCPRATDLASIISTRIVEYMQVCKSQTHGFRELAIHFLEVCETLWPIQQGLLNTSRPESQLPADVTLELRRKLQSTIQNFSSLDLLMSKFLIYERKRGFGKFSKGLGLMFVENDVHRLSENLAKDREALRMGQLAFQWALGDHNSHVSMGNAYASLAAVLRGTNKEKPAPAVPNKLSQQPRALTPASEWTDATKEPAASVAELRSPATTTSTSSSDKLSASTLVDRGNRNTYEDGVLSIQSPLLKGGLMPTEELSRFHFDSSYTDVQSDRASRTTAGSLINFEDMLAAYDDAATPSTRIPVPGPRTTSRPDAKQAPSQAPHTELPSLPRLQDPNSPRVKTLLITAVTQSRHKALEDLLSIGAQPDSITDFNLLCQAIQSSDTESARLLIAYGANVNRVDKDGSTPLLAATLTESIDIARMLLKYGADVSLTSEKSDETPLGIAAGLNNLELVQLYISHGADSNALMPSGETALIKAINKKGLVEIVEHMITAGANPNGKNAEGKSPLLESLFAKRVDMATVLLENGASANLPGPKHPLWPGTYHPDLLRVLLTHGADTKKAPGIMELASSLNCIESVRILLKARVDPNIKKDGIYTPLCSAIRDDRTDIVTLLLANGADPNLKASEYPAWKCITHDHLHLLPQIVEAGADLHNPKGILETAVAFHHKEAVTYLLKHKVDPNAVSPEGYTALTTAIRDNADDYVDLLLENGASPIIRGQDWPLSMAVKRPVILKKLLAHVPKSHKAKGIIEKAVVANQLESVILLVAAGFNVEDKTGGVFSPLTSALREKHQDIVQYLVDEGGADVNAPGEHLPIVKAIRRCDGAHDMGAIAFLLSRGANTNLTYRGWSAIFQALETGDAAILKLLIEKGPRIDLNVEDDSGKTIKEFALERGWQEGADMLLKHAGKA